VRGFSYALRGARFVYSEHPILVRYWSFPILITGLALAGVFWGALSFYDDLASMVWSLLPDRWTQVTGWVGGLVTALRWLFGLIAGALFILLGSILVVLLSSIVAAPFNDALSEAVERIVTGRGAPRFSLRRVIADVVRTIRLEVLKALIYVVIVGPMFLASFFVPGIGQALSVAGFTLSALYLGIDYVDWPAARRDWTVSDRVRSARRHLPAVLGFGAGVWVLLFIPLVNLFFMPAAVAGGTMLFLDLHPSGNGEGRVTKG
jgi:CysZ protein